MLIKNIDQLYSMSRLQVFIPRMTLDHSNFILPIKFQTRQFCSVICFFMTINEIQGHILSQIGQYLPKHVFSTLETFQK